MRDWVFLFCTKPILCIIKFKLLTFYTTNEINEILLGATLHLILLNNINFTSLIFHFIGKTVEHGTNVALSTKTFEVGSTNARFFADVQIGISLEHL